WVAELRARAASRMPAVPQPSDDALRTVLDCPDVGPGNRGLLAVYYQIEGELAPTHPLAQAQTASRILHARALHLRVPACAGPSAASASLWTRFVASQVGDVPCLA